MPVRFGVGEPSLRGYTTDVSSEGIAIKTNQVFPPGTEILVCLDMDGETLTARGCVRWARQVPPLLTAYTRCGMGLEFLAMSPRFRQFLDALEPKI